MTHMSRSSVTLRFMDLNFESDALQVQANQVAVLVQKQYTACGFKFSSKHQYTVLAAFVLSHQDTISKPSKVISLATGCKCLPQSRLPSLGDALHDSHAEILARRGAIRWMFEEVQRSTLRSNGIDHVPTWLAPTANGKWGLKGTVRLHMYISTVPCENPHLLLRLAQVMSKFLMRSFSGGDASMRFIAATQDEEIAALKNTTVFSPSDPSSASRGRDNYSLYGVLRTKPGRADSPLTSCMSCSDKIASWSVLGIQGSLTAKVLEPLYLSTIIIGEVDDVLRSIVSEDCRRAFSGRLSSLDTEG